MVLWQLKNKQKAPNYPPPTTTATLQNHTFFTFPFLPLMDRKQRDARDCCHILCLPEPSIASEAVVWCVVLRL